MASAPIVLGGGPRPDGAVAPRYLLGTGLWHFTQTLLRRPGV